MNGLRIPTEEKEKRQESLERVGEGRAGLGRVLGPVGQELAPAPGLEV